MGNVIKFEDLEIPALTEVAKESFEEALWATEKALAKQLEFGRVMLIVKSKLPYGEWGKWVRETFQDHLSLRTIQTHMKAHEEVAQNPALLECANSLDDILTLTAKPRKPSVEVIEVAADAIEQSVPDKILEETTAAYATGDGIDVVVEPSMHQGYAYLSILIGSECVWLKRPIRRSAIPKLIKGEIPADARLSWEYAENAERVNHALFAIT